MFEGSPLELSRGRGVGRDEGELSVSMGGRIGRLGLQDLEGALAHIVPASLSESSEPTLINVPIADDGSSEDTADKSFDLNGEGGRWKKFVETSWFVGTSVADPEPELLDSSIPT